MVHSRFTDSLHKYFLTTCCMYGTGLKVVNSMVQKPDAIPSVIINSLVMMRLINNRNIMGNALRQGKSWDLRGTQEKH